MSLFRIREFWSAQIGTSEQFHNGLVCVGNILESLKEESRGKIGLGFMGQYAEVVEPMFFATG